MPQQQSLDQFFTPAAEAERCWSWLRPRLPAGAFCVEPAAGGGAFYDLMPADRRMGLDIDPQPGVAGVRQADWLALDALTAGLPAGFVAVGNPPFGRRGSLARAFVSKSFELGAALVGFILPRSGQRGRALGRLAVGDRFELPGGGARGSRAANSSCMTSGAGRSGGRRRRLRAAPPRITSAFTAVRRPGPGPRLRGATFSFRRGVLGGTRPKRRVPVEDRMCSSICIGVEIHREKEAVREHLRGFDWKAAGRPSPNGMLHITCAVVKAALAAGGFVDEADEVIRGATSGCDFYVRGDLGRPQVRDGVYASVDPLPAKWSPVGVKLASASRGKLPRLLAMNWKPYIRPTPTNFGHLTKAAVQRAVAEGAA